MFLVYLLVLSQNEVKAADPGDGFYMFVERTCKKCISGGGSCNVSNQCCLGWGNCSLAIPDDDNIAVPPAP